MSLNWVTITLAFVAALQYLPGRQRAVLLLRDVPGWSTSEAVETLDMSVASVNSALQHARATLKQRWNREADRRTAAINDKQLADLLSRCVAAWESANSNALIAILREDVAMTMPPYPLWFHRRADIQTFLDGYLFKSADPFRLRLVPTHANGAPAFALYQMDQDGIYRPCGLHVLSLQNEAVSEIDDFISYDNRLFSRFGLPLSLD